MGDRLDAVVFVDINVGSYANDSGGEWTNIELYLLLSPLLQNILTIISCRTVKLMLTNANA